MALLSKSLPPGADRWPRVGIETVRLGWSTAHRTVVMATRPSTAGYGAALGGPRLSLDDLLSGFELKAPREAPVHRSARAGLLGAPDTEVKRSHPSSSIVVSLSSSPSSSGRPCSGRS